MGSLLAALMPRARIVAAVRPEDMNAGEGIGIILSLTGGPSDAIDNLKLGVRKKAGVRCVRARVPVALPTTT